MFGGRIGIDLGTASVLVYVKGRGIVVNEPSVVALTPRDNRIVAVGTAAAEMLGRTPGSIAVVRPMRDGVIADYVVTEAMLRYFINRACGSLRVFKPEVVVCIPAGVTSVEQRAVRDAAEQGGARRPAHLVPEPLAAAIGAGIPVGSPRGNIVVDIGGGRTEAAVISMFGIVVSESVRTAGDKIDDAIASYVKRRHNLIIGDRSAEQVKWEVGSAIPLDEELRTDVRGRDQVTGLPQTVVVTSTEITQAIADCIASITAAVKATLERTPPELSADLMEYGIMLTGGSALLRGLDQALSNVTGLPVQVADDPITCVARGAGLALDYLDLIKRNLPTEEESLVASY